MARPLGSAGGGSGGGSVAWGDITGKPTRLGAFTASDETKLDGIQALAAVNPPHIVMAAFEDSDTDLGVQDGVIGLYESDNSLWQGGDPSDMRISKSLFGCDFRTRRNESRHRFNGCQSPSSAV